MTIYVVETAGEYDVLQCGWTLDKNRAELECRERNKKWGEGGKYEYWVEKYSIEKPSDFCEFD